jgi:hypothetical protein
MRTTLPNSLQRKPTQGGDFYAFATYFSPQQRLQVHAYEDHREGDV